MNLVAAVALVLAQGRGVDSLAGRVRQLADSYLAAYFERHPDEATLDGVAGGPDDRLPDDSPLAPRGNVRISLTQLDSLLGTPLGRSPLLDPARRDTTPAFRVELERMLTTDVLPALRGYRDFLERDYLPRARSAIGVSANPDGAACYRASIRATTGLDLSPDAVRRLGIATVAALEAEMRVIARRSFRTRDVGALLGRLRTAAPFTFRSRRAMLDAARGAVLRAKAAMPAWFGRLPRADIVVEPYPAFRERESVGEWNPPAEDGSRPGIYFLSTYDPGHKARADLEALTFHETIPGHHLQGSIALERGQAIPAIARYFWSPGGGEARARSALRRQGVSRPRAGGRGGAAAPVAGEHRAMDRRRAIVLAVAWSAAAAPSTVQAQREPVLKQVGVPHAYYWREMYVPQVTSGPSAVTWSPDGTELIYSMQGSLWRQRIGSRVAQQLTAGEGYDYQPDWSPHGRLVVFARYVHDAIELQLLDLAAKTVQPVTAGRPADGCAWSATCWVASGTSCG